MKRIALIKSVEDIKKMGAKAKNVATKMRAMEDLAARVYRGTDDLVKMDVFRHYREVFAKKGMSKAAANSAAASEVLRWMPQYGAQSGMGELLRGAADAER